jgi:hypothetical protein
MQPWLSAPQRKFGWVIRLSLLAKLLALVGLLVLVSYWGVFR